MITQMNRFSYRSSERQTVCLLLFVILESQIIGCIHAGWKGALSLGIIENTIKKIKKLNSKNKIYASSWSLYWK